MTTRSNSSRPSTRSAIVAITAAIVGGVSSAAVPTAPDPTTVAVHARHVTVGGRTYTDLDELEAALRATRPMSLRIVACEAEATRAWLSVVPRFDDVPLLLDIDPANSACGPVALPVAAAQGAPSGIDDASVRRYWERRLP